jgi:hypothetical protein
LLQFISVSNLKCYGSLVWIIAFNVRIIVTGMISAPSVAIDAIQSPLEGFQHGAAAAGCGRGVHRTCHAPTQALLVTCAFAGKGQEAS